jgi:hypothetical protein
MGKCGPDLSTRSDSVVLPAIASRVDAPWVKVIDAEARLACWRIVEAYSLTGAPFEVQIEWAAGSGVGAKAKVTVPRSARIAVYARQVQVLAGNLSSAENRVGVTVADGFAQTRNVFEERGTFTNDVGDDVPVAPFGDRVRLEIDDQSYLGSTRIRVYDGEGILRSEHAGDAQPDDGTPVGDAGSLQVALPGHTCGYRVVFFLAL